MRGEGIVMDLSLGGCIIKSDTCVSMNDIFYLEIAGMDDDDKPIEVAAMVRSVSTRGIAFKFLRKAQEDPRLLSFIQSVFDSSSLVFPRIEESVAVSSVRCQKDSPGE